MWTSTASGTLDLADGRTDADVLDGIAPCTVAAAVMQSEEGHEKGQRRIMDTGIGTGTGNGEREWERGELGRILLDTTAPPRSTRPNRGKETETQF